jgi:uncharacterized Zn-finger protein
MEMKCPYCDAVGGLTTTHRHMVDTHLEMVTTEQVEAANQMRYTVACPFCEDRYQRQVNPRGRNPRFLEEFKTEIAMVAFDQMLYHILEQHPEKVGVDPAELGKEN